MILTLRFKCYDVFHTASSCENWTGYFMVNFKKKKQIEEILILILKKSLQQLFETSFKSGTYVQMALMNYGDCASLKFPRFNS